MGKPSGTTVTAPRSPVDLPTAAAIGLLAYLTADVAHHALGHGAACLALGGGINALSSIFLDCTLESPTIDLAGPAANLLLGVVALAAVAFRRRLPRSVSLFLVLVAGFNLFWFEMQLVFSAATRTDDWAWAIQSYGIGDVARYGMIVLGALAYWLTVRIIGARLDCPSRSGARSVVTCAWIASGVIACATAAFDRHPVAAIVQHAAPQSLLLSAGLLFAPRAMSKTHASDETTPAISRSWSWIAVAAVASVLSMIFLGPGVPVSF